MPTWLWILIGIATAIFVVAVFVMIYTKPSKKQVDEELRKWGLQNPTCQSCGTVYDRSEVIGQLKLQSPEMFSFGSWSTRFRCKTCRADVEISGAGGM
jgi:hypothetical protein